MDSATKSYRWLFWLLALSGFAVDQVSKYEIFAYQYHAMFERGRQRLPDASADEIFESIARDHEGGSFVIFPGAFRIHVAPFHPHGDDETGVRARLRSYKGVAHRPYVNKGALFGFGQGRNIIFSVVSLLAAAFIIGWSFRPAAARDAFLCTALGLILAGTLGNLYDRVVFEGVRDFLHWHLWIDWPVFNLADVFLVVGAGMLLLEAFFRTPAPDAESAPPQG